MSCNASSRFHASDGAAATASRGEAFRQIPLRYTPRWPPGCSASTPSGMHPASRHRSALGGDRTHHRALPQQPGRVVLILDPKVEERLPAAGRTRVVNQVDIESALTAIATRVRSDEPPPISASASDSSSLVWAASRSSGTPAGVATVGFSRRTRTWPTRCSNALIRWLTADGVTCRCTAAASKLPCSITAANAASCWPSICTLVMLMHMKNH